MRFKYKDCSLLQENYLMCHPEKIACSTLILRDSGIMHPRFRNPSVKKAHWLKTTQKSKRKNRKHETRKRFPSYHLSAVCRVCSRDFLYIYTIVITNHHQSLPVTSSDQESPPVTTSEVVTVRYGRGVKIFRKRRRRVKEKQIPEVLRSEYQCVKSSTANLSIERLRLRMRVMI